MSCFLAAREPKNKGMWSQGWFSEADKVENPNPEDSPTPNRTEYQDQNQNRVPAPSRNHTEAENCLCA